MTKIKNTIKLFATMAIVFVLNGAITPFLNKKPTEPKKKQTSFISSYPRKITISSYPKKTIISTLQKKTTKGDEFGYRNNWKEKISFGTEEPREYNPTDFLTTNVSGMVDSTTTSGGVSLGVRMFPPFN